MKIELSPEALQTIQNLCDLALRAGGLKNLQQVNSLMREVGDSIAEIELAAAAKKSAPAN